MIQHTPGPWTFYEQAMFDSLRFYVSQKKGAPYTPYYAGVATLITETVPGEQIAIQCANARLIAAAPCLLDALKLAQLHINGGPGIQDGMAWWAMYDQINAAIAKATGEAP